jgi:hypothetical protein
MWVKKRKLKEYFEDLEYKIEEQNAEIRCLERKMDEMANWRLIQHVVHDVIKEVPIDEYKNRDRSP